MRRRTGGCLCGAVRYVADGEPINELICHCRLCQRAVGAPFFARALFRLAQVEVSGKVAAHRSSPSLERCFCPSCGTALFARRADLGVVGVSAATFDAPDDFRPSAHIWTSSRRRWLGLEDGLAHHPEGLSS